MNSPASWWDTPGQNGDTPVVRHAPDDDQYHIASDPEMVGKMRGSLVGRFAIIPKADRDGASKAFDPSVAGPCHVDPGAPDGGVVFDPSNVHKQDVEQAVAESYYPHEAFYRLGRSAPELGFGRRNSMSEQAPARTNSKMPGAYLTPEAGRDGRQMASQPAYTPYEEPHVPVPQLPPLPVSAPMPMPAPNQIPSHGGGPAPSPMPAAWGSVPPYGQPYGYPPPPQDPLLAALANGMINMQNTLSVIAERVSPPPGVLSPQAPRSGPPQGLASVPVEMQGGRLPSRVKPPSRSTRTAPAEEEDDWSDDAARPIRRAKRPVPAEEEAVEEQPRSLLHRQRVSEYENPEREPEGVVVGFETLELAWLSGPIATKPKRRVYFDIPGAGTHSAIYHDVIVSDGEIVLVYDTRYDDGDQYMPPNLGGDVRIKLTLAGAKKGQNAEYVVSSIGINFRFGVMDMFVLVRTEPDEVESGVR